MYSFSLPESQVYFQRLRLWNLIFPRVGITSKGVSRPLSGCPRVGRTSKGALHPLPGFADFFCLRNKRNRRKKSTSLNRRAAFYASIFAPLSADCESSAYLVFGFAEWFRYYFYQELHAL